MFIKKHELALLIISISFLCETFIISQLLGYQQMFLYENGIKKKKTTTNGDMVMHNLVESVYHYLSSL